MLSICHSDQTTRMQSLSTYCRESIGTTPHALCHEKEAGKGLQPISQIDELEAEMAKCEKVVCPVEHHFTPGLYIRQCDIPAGTFLTSMQHKTEHPFALMQGTVKLISSTEGEIILTAPFLGRTLPGTRRILYAITDAVWITFHATEETDVEKIGEAILEPFQNPLISDIPQWRDSLPPSKIP